MDLRDLRVDLVRLLLSLSHGLDFTHGGLLNHHQHVALMALEVGRAAGLTPEDLLQLFKAAIIHDAGAVTFREKLALAQFDVENPAGHCHRGAEFAAGVHSLGTAPAIILSHHDRWLGGNPSGCAQDRIPLAARIIHLVDRVDVLLRPGVPVLEQRSAVLEQVRAGAGTIFDPDLVALLDDLAARESFWLDLASPWLSEHLLRLLPSPASTAGGTDLLELAGLFARVVDAKSHFTYTHSRAVAAAACRLGRQAGLPPEQCDLLQAAGLLHDLGKVTVPEDILEKPGRLTAAEFNTIKQHAYYTYWLLKPVLAGWPLVEWAAYHHERLDGQGYPFRKAAPELDLGARIVAVADVFTALSEDRPYRPGLPWTETKRILEHQARSGALDPDVVGILAADPDLPASFLAR
ncbi:HD-GYP domain-containing protein [Gelria sp. Kuro-4]|uniref:HD-GYP domain-containing protein n=1 Tax=Gelria sp. Kuro-4 TaxID=2796927 RepID=UPI001BF17129|nr:HD domain-containing phosphohydrolase [Gelria sp. Kuro-4]BCV23229.1 HD domain-containing protein [Gelria sp. Kuro-4]